MVVVVGISLFGCDRSRTPVVDSDKAVESGKEDVVQERNELIEVRDRPRHSATPKASRIVPRFASVAAASGIEFTFFNDAVPERYFLPEIMGGGAGYIDYDLDGLFDLFLVNGCELRPDVPPSTDHPNALFRNRGGGKFSRVEGAAGAVSPGFGQGCAVGDFDADGFEDLYVAYYGQDRLFHNLGDGTFEDVTQRTVIPDDRWGSSVAWFDVNADGLLDLYVVNYLDVSFENSRVCNFDGKPGYCGPGDYEAVPDYVLISQGDGTFLELSEQLGLTADKGKGLAVTAVDFDDDLKPEIYVANDMAANFLFTRSSVPTTDSASRKMYIDFAFEGGSAVSGVGLNEASMGIACGDFDHDQRIDMVITNFFIQGSTVYRNLGRLFFVDDRRRARIGAASYLKLGFGTCCLDFDRDGSQDVFFANGHVLGPHHSPYQMEAQLLHNDGQGRFDDVSTAAGEYFQAKWLGRSVASGDYDNDGDTDLVVTHLDEPVALLRNDTETPHHFLAFDLRTESRIPPVGGRVIVRSGGKTQTLPIVAGESYLSSRDPRIVAGIPGETAEIEVHWPTGRVDKYTDLERDRYWLLIEPESSHKATRLQEQALESKP